MASGERAPQATRLLVIGNFDGVHLGHQAVVAEAVREATRRGLVPTVLTFDPHPAVILGRPARPMLTTVARKTDLLRRLDPRLEVVVLPFDLELASLTPDQFAQRILRGKLAAELVLVGQNSRFGKD